MTRDRRSTRNSKTGSAVAAAAPPEHQAPSVVSFEVDIMGLGFALISRSVFDRLAREGNLGRYPAAVVLSVQRTGTLLGFFDRMQGSDGRISEDYSFCHRWRKIGGQVWLDPTANIRHVGAMRFGFPLATALTRRES
jgi:hypothetical protein